MCKSAMAINAEAFRLWMNHLAKPYAELQKPKQGDHGRPPRVRLIRKVRLDLSPDVGRARERTALDVPVNSKYYTQGTCNHTNRMYHNGGCPIV